MKLFFLASILALLAPMAHAMCITPKIPAESLVMKRIVDVESSLGIGDDCELSPSGWGEQIQLKLVCGETTYHFSKEIQ